MREKVLFTSRNVYQFRNRIVRQTEVVARRHACMVFFSSMYGSPQTTEDIRGGIGGGAGADFTKLDRLLNYFTKQFTRMTCLQLNFTFQ